MLINNPSEYNYKHQSQVSAVFFSVMNNLFHNIIKKKSKNIITSPFTKLNFFSFLSIFFLLSIILSACAGKTVVLKSSNGAFASSVFIPKKKRTIFIAYPINYTQTFGLDQTFRDRLMEYFQNNNTPFEVTDQIDEASSYMIIKIYSYQFRASLVKFDEAKIVNRYYRTRLEVTLQDTPKEFLTFSITGDNPSNIKTYLENEPILLRKYYYLNLQNPLQSKEELEKKFLTEVAQKIEHLLKTGGKQERL